MVNEFPELQGVMGVRPFAGEEPDVAVGIRNIITSLVAHLPQTPAGIVAVSG